MVRRSDDFAVDFDIACGEYSPATLAIAHHAALLIGGYVHEGSREGPAGGRRARELCAPRLCRYHADHRHRQQRRHDPDAEADGRFHQGQSRHQAQLGHARRERAAPEGDDRHRHQGRSVRRADHWHLRSPDLGEEGLARPARQARSRLRRRRPAARRSARAFRSTASSTPRRSMARARSSCTART